MVSKYFILQSKSKRNHYQYNIDNIDLEDLNFTKKVSKHILV